MGKIPRWDDSVHSLLKKFKSIYKKKVTRSPGRRRALRTVRGGEKVLGEKGSGYRQQISGTKKRQRLDKRA